MLLRHRIPPAATLFAVLFTSQAGFLVLTPVLPLVAADFGVPTATAGALRIAGGVAGAAVALALAVGGSRFGLRNLIATGLTLVGLGAAAAAAAPTFAILASTQLAMGAGNAMLLSGGVAAAARWSAPGDRARVVAIVLLGQPASWIVGMPLIGALADSSWRLAMLVPVGASVATIFALATRPADAPAPTAGGFRALLSRERGVAFWATGELLAYSAWGGTLTFAGALIIDSYAPSSALVGLLLAGAAAAYFPGNMLARRPVDAHPRRALAALGLSLAVLSAAFGIVRPGLGFSVGAFALIVMAVGGRTLAGSTAGLRAAPGNEVAVMSLRAAAHQLGLVAGAALGGIALAAGGYPMLGLALALLFAAGALPHLGTIRVRFLRRTRGFATAVETGC